MFFKTLTLVVNRGNYRNYWCEWLRKSVLFKLIAGLYSPSYGEVLINGENIVPERKIPANLGALIEEPGFINYYSGFKNLQYLASIRGVVGNQEINDTLKIVGLYEQKTRKLKLIR